MRLGENNSLIAFKIKILENSPVNLMTNMVWIYFDVMFIDKNCNIGKQFEQSYSIICNAFCFSSKG